MDEVFFKIASSSLNLSYPCFYTNIIMILNNINHIIRGGANVYKLFILLIVLLTISLSGCNAVQTNITSHTIQEYAADSYENILVFANIGSLSEMKSIEEM